MSRSIAGLICVVFLLAQMSQPFAQTLVANQSFMLAQLETDSSVSGIDLDPPQVDHIPVASGVAGAIQSISVRASDVQGIASVTLFYRSNTSVEYKQQLMRPVYGTENFTAGIDTSPEHSVIEYYFLVIDTGGNKVLNGFPYEPFARMLTAPVIDNAGGSESQIAADQEAKASGTGTAGSGAAGATGEGRRSNASRLLWIALGVLAVGALASAGGGGGSSQPASEDTVPVILNVPVPQ